MTIYLDPKIWGPHYWYFLHTIALSYPNYPNAVTKKKYYELIQNFPLFIPVEQISKEFSHLLDNYPIQPYLDKRESFVKWTWFIHNKVNEKLEKPILSLEDFYIQYYEEYKSTIEKIKDYSKLKGKITYGILLFSIGCAIYYMYDK
jgi:hypothetical protein